MLVKSLNVNLNQASLKYLNFLKNPMHNKFSILILRLFQILALQLSKSGSSSIESQQMARSSSSHQSTTNGLSLFEVSWFVSSGN